MAPILKPLNLHWFNQPRRSIRSFARETGISKSTLYDWVTHYRHQNNLSSRVPSQDRSLPQRLRAIKDCDQLSETEIGQYCRTQGIYRQHLEAWRNSLMNDHEALKILKIQVENKHLQKEKLKLERTLKIREKRLAEAYALLELKKK